MPDETCGIGEWQVVKTVRNPWGQVPLTGAGRSLQGRSREYMNRLVEQSRARDPVSRRHHYVPKSYLRQWSTDGKRIWALDTMSGSLRQLGLSDVCVKEDFYRVVGPDGEPHNRVELMFGVVDAELRRIQLLFDQLEDPEALQFDDLIGLGVSMAVQRMRTVQERRLQLQYSKWMAAQDPSRFQSLDNDPYQLAGVHTELLFKAMWEAADVLTTRQIEVWHDPQGRFMTCDAPVLIPFVRNVRPSLMAAPYVIWPVSPHRAVALSNDLDGEKAVIREATGKMVGIVTRGVEQGRERMIFASEDRRNKLQAGKKLTRRTQTRMRCSDRTPQGVPVPPPGCCVEWSQAFAAVPDISLCNQGLHSLAHDLEELA